MRDLERLKKIPVQFFISDKMSEAVRKAYEPFKDTIKENIPNIDPRLVVNAIEYEKKHENATTRAEIQYRLSNANIYEKSVFDKKKEELSKLGVNMIDLGIKNRLIVRLPLKLDTLVELARDNDIELVE